MDYRVWLGLAMVLAVFWIVNHMPVHSARKQKYDEMHHPTPKEVLAQFRAKDSSPLANGKRRLVKCSVATNYVPKYRRSTELHIRAQELATSVALRKLVIAKHMSRGKMEVCSPGCDIRTTIAGVVRDRKKLKQLEYDQPF